MYMCTVGLVSDNKLLEKKNGSKLVYVMEKLEKSQFIEFWGGLERSFIRKYTHKIKTNLHMIILMFLTGDTNRVIRFFYLNLRQKYEVKRWWINGISG